jgi:hypothetical protein
MYVTDYERPKNHSSPPLLYHINEAQNLQISHVNYHVPLIIRNYDIVTESSTDTNEAMGWEPPLLVLPFGDPAWSL